MICQEFNTLKTKERNLKNINLNKKTINILFLSVIHN